MIKNFAVVNTTGTVTTIEATGLLKAVATVQGIVEHELPTGYTVQARRQNTRHIYPIVVDLNVYDATGRVRDDLTVSVRRAIEVSYVPFASIDADADADI